MFGEMENIKILNFNDDGRRFLKRCVFNLLLNKQRDTKNLLCFGHATYVRHYRKYYFVYIFARRVCTS